MILNGTSTSNCFSGEATTTICETSYNLVSSSTPVVFNGFTSGEIVNSVLLFMIFLGIILNIIVAKFMGQKIQPRV
jgi:hypothetical protein